MKQLLLKRTDLTESSVEMSGTERTGIIIRATKKNKLAGRAITGVVFFDVKLDLEVVSGGNFKIIPTIHPGLAKRGVMLTGAYSFDGGRHLRMHFFKPVNKVTLADGDEMLTLNFVEPLSFTSVDEPMGKIKLTGNKRVKLDDQKTQKKTEAKTSSSTPVSKKTARARKTSKKSI